jgi:hypothetical protein
MTDAWISIRYRDFYDIPRAFVVEYMGKMLFFDCPFDESLDEYVDKYTVYCIKDELRDGIDKIPWTDLARRSHRIGAVPTEAVKFDATRRNAIDAQVFELLGIKAEGKG